jgi:Uncharacterized protein, possibly involved in utilization of glycolate and propanediol
MKEANLQTIVETVYLEIQSKKMNLAKASLLIKKIETKATEMGVAAVIAVSNEAARPIAVHCMDDSLIASYDVAFQKAYTVVALKRSTLELKKLCQPGESLYGLQFTNDGKIVIFGGGVPLIYQGKIIGGLGVSGGTEEQDSALAEYGQHCLEEVMTCQ